MIDLSTVIDVFDSMLGVFAPMIGLALGFALIARFMGMIRTIKHIDAPADSPPITPRIDEMIEEDWRDFEFLHSPTPQAKPRVKLPRKCPDCGGPGNAYLTGPNESVVCGFCGSLISGEER
jgi:hypothetical protein